MSWSLHYGSITPVGMRIEVLSTFIVAENVTLTLSLISGLSFVTTGSYTLYKYVSMV